MCGVEFVFPESWRCDPGGECSCGRRGDDSSSCSPSAQGREGRSATTHSLTHPIIDIGGWGMNGYVEIVIILCRTASDKKFKFLSDTVLHRITILSDTILHKFKFFVGHCPA